MNPRIIFPTFMFVLAGASFAYGTWQWLYSRQVQTASDARVAHIMEQVDRLAVSDTTKQDLYAAVFQGYPAAPKLFGIDFSGSFASQQAYDACENDGQRSVCRSLKSASADSGTYAEVCGACSPK